MSLPDSSDRAAPRFSAAVVLPPALLAVLLFWLAWLLRESRKENAGLRTELAEVRLAHRVAASHESLAAEAARRAARLEETLVLMRRSTGPLPPATTAPDPHRAEELERVIIFLRGEITAAHETIERLKATGRADREAEKADVFPPGKKSPPGL